MNELNNQNKIEDIIKELEELTDKLKSDDYLLDEKINIYEKCLKLHKEAISIIDNTKQKIEKYNPSLNRIEDFDIDND